MSPSDKLRYRIIRWIRIGALVLASLYGLRWLNVHPLVSAALAAGLPHMTAGVCALASLLCGLQQRSRPIGWGLGLLALSLLAGIAPSKSPPSRIGDAEGLTLVTFNVSAKHGQRDRIEAWLRNQNADLVLLQETYLARDGIFDPDAPLLPYVRVQTTRLGYRGLALLSRFPLSAGEGFDEESPFVRAVVDIGQGRAIAIYAVSLAAPFGSQEAGRLTDPWSLIVHYDPVERNRQFTELVARLDGESLPTIIAGDFNMTEYDPEYQELLDLGFVDSFRAVDRSLGPTFPSGGPGILRWLPPVLRIDYVWHSADFLTLVSAVGPGVVSDHLPLVVSLKWNYR